MRPARLIGLALLAGLSQSGPSRAAELSPGTLRVGIVDGVPPCTFRHNSEWQGLSVDLWSRIAQQTGQTFTYVAQPNTSVLLEATRRNLVDVGIGCLSITPDRLGRYRFSLPFQEDGLAVLARRRPLEVGQALLLSLLAPDLLRLLGGLFLAMTLLAAALWWFEERLNHPGTTAQDRRRSFASTLQILITGPGTNTLGVTVRSNLLIVVAYLFRLVFASMLVSYITVNVVQQSQGRRALAGAGLDSLRGQRVAVRQGSVSAGLLERLNHQARLLGQPPVILVPVSDLDQALVKLERDDVFAILGDSQQLRYLRRQSDHPAGLELAIQDLRVQSRALALAPELPVDRVEAINRAIARLKEEGVVQELQRDWLGP